MAKYPLVDIRKTIPKHPTRRWSKRKTPATHIVVHSTASNNQDPNKTARYHITPSPDNHISVKGAPGLCYHDFITKAGVVYHCNDYRDITWHAGGYNGRSVSVVMAFTGQTGEAPEMGQYAHLLQHLVYMCLYLKIIPKNVIGHREVPGMWTWIGKGSKKYKKTCPGMGVDMDAIRTEVSIRLQLKLQELGLYRGPIDGDFGTQSQAALGEFKI